MNGWMGGQGGGKVNGWVGMGVVMRIRILVYLIKLRKQRETLQEPLGFCVTVVNSFFLAHTTSGICRSTKLSVRFSFCSWVALVSTLFASVVGAVVQT